MAGSVFGKIAERVYAKDLRLDLMAAADSTSCAIPTVKAGNLNETLCVLDKLDIPVQQNFDTTQERELWGQAEQTPDAVTLQQRDLKPDQVPSVIGMGAKDAVYLLESQGLKVRVNGVGKVKRQSIAAGSRLVKGQTVSLQLRQ